MKQGLTGYSEEARVLAVERYIVARLQSRNHGKGENISAEDLMRQFKLRDVPVVAARRALPEHRARLAYFGELLGQAAASLRAKALTRKITQECAPAEGAR